MPPILEAQQQRIWNKLDLRKLFLRVDLNHGSLARKYGKVDQLEDCYDIIKTKTTGSIFIYQQQEDRGEVCERCLCQGFFCSLMILLCMQVYLPQVTLQCYLRYTFIPPLMKTINMFLKSCTLLDTFQYAHMTSTRVQFLLSEWSYICACIKCLYRLVLELSIWKYLWNCTWYGLCIGTFRFVCLHLSRGHSREHVK